MDISNVVVYAKPLGEQGLSIYATIGRKDYYVLHHRKHSGLYDYLRVPRSIREIRRFKNTIRPEKVYHGRIGRDRFYEHARKVKTNEIKDILDRIIKVVESFVKEEMQG